MTPSLNDYIRILPEIVVTLFGMLIMIVDPLLPEQIPKKPLGVVAILGTLAGLAATGEVPADELGPLQVIAECG